MSPALAEIFSLVSLLGAAISFLGSFLLLVAAIRTSIGWGLTVFFIPGVGPLLFCCICPREAKLPFLIILSGLIIVFLSLIGHEMALGKDIWFALESTARAVGS